MALEYQLILSAVGRSQAPDKARALYILKEFRRSGDAIADVRFIAQTKLLPYQDGQVDVGLVIEQGFRPAGIDAFELEPADPPAAVSAVSGKFKFGPFEKLSLFSDRDSLNPMLSIDAISRWPVTEGGNTLRDQANTFVLFDKIVTPENRNGELGIRVRTALKTPLHDADSNLVYCEFVLTKDGIDRDGSPRFRKFGFVVVTDPLRGRDNRPNREDFHSPEWFDTEDPYYSIAQMQAICLEDDKKLNNLPATSPSSTLSPGAKYNQLPSKLHAPLLTKLGHINPVQTVGNNPTWAQFFHFRLHPQRNEEDPIQRYALSVQRFFRHKGTGNSEPMIGLGLGLEDGSMPAHEPDALKRRRDPERIWCNLSPVEDSPGQFPPDVSEGNVFPPTKAWFRQPSESLILKSGRSSCSYFGSDESTSKTSWIGGIEGFGADPENFLEIAEWINQSYVEPYLGGLKRVEGGLNLSFVPRILMPVDLTETRDGIEPTIVARASASDKRTPRLGFAAYYKVTVGNPATVRRDGKPEISQLRLSFRGIWSDSLGHTFKTSRWGGPQAGAQPAALVAYANLVWSNLLDEAATPLLRRVAVVSQSGSLTNLTKLSDDGLPASHQPIASLRLADLTQPTGDVRRTVTIGAVSSDFDAGLTSWKTYRPDWTQPPRILGAVEFRLRTGPDFARQGKQNGPLFGSRCEIEVLGPPASDDPAFRLPLVVARPGGEDHIPGALIARPADEGEDSEAQTVALVFPFGDIPSFLPQYNKLEPKSFGYFTVKERTGGPTLRYLKFGIEAPSEAAQPGAGAQVKIALIQRQPLAVMAVEMATLAGNDESLEVAYWDNSDADGGNWVFKAPQGHVDLILPPQAIGEQVLREFPKKTHFQKDRLAGMAFGLRTHLRVEPGYFQSAFAEAFWNFARIFGYSGQRAPGAWLTDAAIEFTYGLPLRLSGVKGLRIAEIGARQGDLVTGTGPDLNWGEMVSEDPNNFLADQLVQKARFAQAWSAARAALATRLAALELYRDDDVPGRQTGPRTLVLEEGLAYKIREKTKLQPPPDVKIPDSNLNALRAARAANQQTPGSPPAFMGSVEAGFPSTNTYTGYLDFPKSTAARLSAPFLSAHGGFAKEKVEFKNGLITVYTHVIAGRIAFYSIELKGRIGVFWHPGKLVFIYRRGVGPTQQMYDNALAKNDLEIRGFDGLGALRKAEIYVELIEPDRAYPDLGGPELACGPIRSASFQKQPIPVNDAWGSDVGQNGYQVPLWQPDQPGVAYAKKPEVHVVFAADPREGGDVPSRVANPQIVYFYTDTQTLEPDTNKWPSVPGIDYPSSAIETETDPKDTKGADPVEVVPGLERFTFRLEDANAKAVNLTERRFEKIVGSVLRSVYLSRATLRKVDPEAVKDAIEALPEKDDVRKIGLGKHIAAQALKKTAAAIERGAKAILQLYAQDPKPTDQQVLDILKDAFGIAPADISKNPFGGLPTTIAGWKPTDELCDIATQPIKTTAAAWEVQAAELLEQNLRELESIIAELKRSAGVKIEELRATAKERLKTAYQTFDAVETRLSAISKLIEPIAGVLADVRRDIDNLRTEIDQQRLLASRAIASLRSGVALGDLKKTLTSILAQLRSDLAVVRDRWPTASKKVLSVVAAKMPAAVPELQKLIARIDSWIAELDSGLSAIDQALNQGGDVATAVKALGDKLQAYWNTAIDPNLDTIQNALARVSAQIKLAQDEVIAPIESIPSRIVAFGRTAFQKADAAIDTVDPDRISDPFRKLQEEIGDAFKFGDPGLGIEKRIKDAADQICERILSKIESIAKQIEAALACAIDDIQNAGGIGAKQILEKYVNGPLADAANVLRDGLAKIESRLDDAARRLLAGIWFDASLPHFRLPRAWGEVPNLPNLGFDLKNLAYYFDEAIPQVDMTWVHALVGEAGPDLKSFSLKFPTFGLDGDLLPNLKIAKPDYTDVFKNMGGASLKGFLKNFKISDDLLKNIKITHGFDKESRKGWLQADIDNDLGADRTLLDVGPVRLGLEKGKFLARARGEVGLDGKSDLKDRYGLISGNWTLGLGGSVFIRFRDSSLNCRNGKISFDIDPSKVELPGALEYINAMLSSTNSGGDDGEESGSDDSGGEGSYGGSPLKWIKNDAGLPIGTRYALDISYPPMIAGAWGVTGLRLQAGIELYWADPVADPNGGPGFSIRGYGMLATKAKPFTITVFVLGGCGFVAVSCKFYPLSGTTQTLIEIMLAASAMIGFSIGVASGTIQIFVGVYIRYLSGQGGGTQAAFIFGFCGDVLILGLVWVNITLILEAQLTADNRVNGRGTLSATISLGRFIKKSVRREVRRQL